MILIKNGLSETHKLFHIFIKQPKTVIKILQAKDPANNIMASKRRFGLEESDDDDYEEQPAFKKRNLQTNRSYSSSRASFQKSTSVQRKNSYGYFIFSYIDTKKHR